MKLIKRYLCNECKKIAVLKGGVRAISVTPERRGMCHNCCKERANLYTLYETEDSINAKDESNHIQQTRSNSVQGEEVVANVKDYENHKSNLSSSADLIDAKGVQK